VGKTATTVYTPPRNPLQNFDFPLGESTDPVRISVKSFRPVAWNHQSWQFGTWTSSSDFDLPLHRRAWTFQERLLAKRIVHFSPLEMVWECWTSTSCECGELQHERFQKVFPGAKAKQREAITDGGVQNRLKAWDGVIAGYSVRDITYYQDRVQAIAGIALQFDMDNGSSAGSNAAGAGLGRYLCGIWEADLPMGLLWYSLLTNPGVLYYRGPHHRQRSWTVPTWSWLSVQGDVSHAEREGIESPLASLTDITYEVSSDNPYGAPLDIPTLTVRGMTVKLEMQDQGSAICGREYTLSHPLLVETCNLESDACLLDLPFEKSQVKALRITTRRESDAMNCLIVCEVGVLGRFERIGLASIPNELFDRDGVRRRLPWFDFP